MTAEIHEFDAPVGCHCRMSLFCPPDEAHHAKTSDKEDMVVVRFVELSSPRGIVEAVRSVSTDPALLGEMTMTASFDEAEGGAEVMLIFENLPSGLRPEDNDEGARLSLEQTAHHLE